MASERINADLIFGSPDELQPDWREYDHDYGVDDNDDPEPIAAQILIDMLGFDLESDSKSVPLTPKDIAACLSHKSFDCSYKSEGEEAEFTLYGAVFGNVDRQGDLIEKGAFANLEELQKDGWIADCHDQSAPPLAWIKSATQDDHGLRIVAIWHSTPNAQLIRTIVKERMAAGRGVKCSIGYIVPPDGERYERTNGRMVRHINKLSAYEVSIVWLPANPAAEVTEVKAIPDFTLDGFEDTEDLHGNRRGYFDVPQKATWRGHQGRSQDVRRHAGKNEGLLQVHV